MDDAVVLKRADYAPRASVGLHLLVKNGAAVLPRLLECVGPYIKEVVAVVNDTTDDTCDVLLELGSKYGLRVLIVELTSEMHPEIYIRDVPETYEVGHSLAGERYEGPFTGRPLLADWAAARNLGWGHHESDWRLFLDADDVVDDPQSIPGLCDLLASRGLDAASTRYVAGDSGGSRERLCRNVSHIRWEGAVHERLVGFDPARVAHVEGSLVVRDLRDSPGEGLRAPGRNLKVLYHRARSLGWQIDNRHRLYLASEAMTAMSRLSARLIEDYLPLSEWPAEAAWACSMMGQICEDEQQLALASSWYERALDRFPSAAAAMRLCRSRFREGRHAEAVAAYERGLLCMSAPQPLDQSDLLERSTVLLAAVAERELGHLDEAAALYKKAQQHFPQNEHVREMLADLESGKCGKS